MLYALNTLRAHGMNNEGIQEVLRAKIVSKLTYASPAWSGFASQLDINKIDRFLSKAKKLNFYPTEGPTITQLWSNADDKLFQKFKIIHTMFYTNCCPWNLTQDITLEPENIHFASLLKTIETS